jgi:hypothetical protein
VATDKARADIVARTEEYVRDELAGDTSLAELQAEWNAGDDW